MTKAPELFPIDEINIEPRLRNAASDGVLAHIDRLCESINRFGGHPYGLLQPVIIDETNTLQDGWCRFTACVKLKWPTIPIYRRSKLSDDEYREVELESNLMRLGFTWQQTVKGVVDIHEARRKAAVLRGEKWTREMTGELLGGYSSTYVDNCCNLAPLLDRDEYKACEGITDAVRLLLREKEDKLRAEQARRLALKPTTVPVVQSDGSIQGQGSPLSLLDGDEALTGTPLAPGDSPPQTIDLSNTLFLGDSIRVILPQWPANCVDHIITDPPYGIDMDNLQQTTNLNDISRVADEHDVEENLSLFNVMFPVLHRILKPSGYLVLWCDVMNFRLLHDLATAADFKVQRWPIVWHKTSQCKNQQGNINLTKNVEFALVCRKEKATLPKVVLTTVITCPNETSSTEASNPFAKPHALWQQVFEWFTHPGQTVLDPFAGEGSSILSGIRLNRSMLAIEKRDIHFNQMLGHVRDYWKQLFKNVNFK